jgi:hypothetical protein
LARQLRKKEWQEEFKNLRSINVTEWQEENSKGTPSLLSGTLSNCCNWTGNLRSNPSEYKHRHIIFLSISLQMIHYSDIYPISYFISIRGGRYITVMNHLAAY